MKSNFVNVYPGGYNLVYPEGHSIDDELTYPLDYSSQVALVKSLMRNCSNQQVMQDLHEYVMKACYTEEELADRSNAFNLPDVVSGMMFVDRTDFNGFKGAMVAFKKRSNSAEYMPVYHSSEVKRFQRYLLILDKKIAGVNTVDFRSSASMAFLSKASKGMSKPEAAQLVEGLTTFEYFVKNVSLAVAVLAWPVYLLANM